MRRLFLLVAAVVLVDTMFFAAITPLLPDYSDELGLSRTAAGILSAAYAAGTLLGTFPGAVFASRAGVRPTVLVGLGLMSAAGLVFAFAESIVVLDAARFLQGVGGAFSWIGGLAWLVSASSPERRGELIGSALAAAIFGVLLGPVVGSIASVAGTEAVFSSAAVLGGALAVATLRMAGPEPTSFPGFQRLREAIASGPVLIAFWLVMLPAIFSGVIWVLAPLRLAELGASAAGIGAVFLVSAFMEGAASPWFGRLSDRRGRMWPIRIGLVAATVAALFLPIPDLVVAAGAGVIAAEFTLGFCWAPATALLSESVESAGVEQWFAFALVNLAWAGGQVVGGSGAGGLADVTSDDVPFIVVAGLLALTVVAVTMRRPAANARVVSE